jgi:hypothetical protein
MPIDSFGSRWSLSFVFAAALVACVLVGGTAAADEETSPTRAAGGAAPARNGSAFVDPLGFLLFGPRVGVEIGGGRVSGALYGRWFNLGLLSHSLFLNDGDDFGLSYGAGLRGRYYLSEGLEGAHVGIAVEYLRTRIETPSVLIATVSGYAVPYAEAGYRFTVGSFYADASAALGYAFKLSGSVENLPGGSAAGSYQAQDKSSIYGSASLDLGVYF